MENKLKLERKNSMTCLVKSVKDNKIAGEFVYSGRHKKWLFFPTNFSTYTEEGLTLILEFQNCFRKIRF